ncbi:hypothetical protein RJ640_008873 [Escallonia rubra]|uniref:CRIB domain-containing protein n=1 Tax=Escallonia rubra TaxID=112253 RepID=A0AA88QAA0_9ASTE|nr:hypothetical protein RJ640_008873 [Escallonia rubra]
MTRLFRSKSCGVGAQSAFASSPPPSPSFYLTNDEEEDEEEEEEEDEEFDGYFGNNRITTPFIAPDDRQQGQGSQFPVLAVLAAALRKSLVTCSVETDDASSLDIGSPKDVMHVSHVTFDRFNGFLGLPVELEPEVSPKAPSARLCYLIQAKKLDASQVFPCDLWIGDLWRCRRKRRLMRRLLIEQEQVKKKVLNWTKQRKRRGWVRCIRWMAMKLFSRIFSVPCINKEGFIDDAAAYKIRADAIIDELVPKCKYKGKSLVNQGRIALILKTWIE